MGCFSFMCKECGKPVLSNSFTGQRVKLFLLDGGEVIQDMEGEYDSYGRVFVDGSQRADVEHELKESVHWKLPDVEADEDSVRLYGSAEVANEQANWSAVCDLMFSGSPGSGIAAVHTACFKEVPTTKSDDDPNQGWGEDWELFGDTDPETELE